MSSYFITGCLGSGKGLVSVGRIFDYLKQGRKVATNVDIFLTPFFGLNSKKNIIRLPDKPNLFDMQVIGEGCDEVGLSEDGSPVYSEDQHGLIVLDELGSWFNSRGWQDKERKPLLDWFIHARKHGWDTLFIVQGIDMVDGQLRGMLGEHLVTCKRLDRVKIPYLGSVLRWFGLTGNFPKIHRAKVRYGDTAADLVLETWTYTGQKYYPCYNTKQRFSSFYDRGVFSVLSPWHMKGRYLRQDGKPVLTFEEKPLMVRRIAKLPANQRIAFTQQLLRIGAL